MQHLLGWKYSALWVGLVICSSELCAHVPPHAHPHIVPFFFSGNSSSQLVVETIRLACSTVSYAASDGQFSPSLCEFLSNYGELCGCANVPDHTMVPCTLCPISGVQNPYVLVKVLLPLFFLAIVT
jgi:hypothetical protein